MLCSAFCWQPPSPPVLFCDRRLCDVQPYSIQKGVFHHEYCNRQQAENQGYHYRCPAGSDQRGHFLRQFRPLYATPITIIPYAIAAKAMADQMITDGRQDTILAASEMLQSWVSVALVAGVIVAAFIGAMIGKRIVKKHLAA